MDDYTTDLMPIGGVDPTVAQSLSGGEVALPEDAKALRKKLYELSQAQVTNQQNQLKSQKDRLDKFAQEGQKLDLAPLLSYWDKSEGTNLLAGYQRPESKLEHERRLGDLQDKVAKQQDQLSENQTKLLSLAIKEKMGDQAVAAKKELHDQGNKLPGSNAESLGNADAAIQALDDVKTLHGQTYSDITGPFQGLKSKIQGTFELGDAGVRAKEFQAALDARKQIIGKYLEGGVLRKEDEAKYQRMLPQITDGAQVAQSKIENLQRLIAQRQQADLKAFSQTGYNVGQVTRLPLKDLPGSTAPKAGFTRNGYKFKGGDPSKKSSWEKI